MYDRTGSAVARRAPFVDTHAHLDDEAFDGDREDVLARAREAGVVTIVNIGYAESRWPSTLALAREQRDVYAVLGVHPHEAGAWSAGVESRLQAALDNERVVGVGEIGLDFHRTLAAATEQRRAFAAQVEVARARNLPIVVHSRDAEVEVVRMLQAVAPVRGVLHSFAGSDRTARLALELGLHLSLTGPVTYPNGHRQRELARLIPLDRLLLETDAPYLAPQQRRGRRNEPAYLTFTASAIAAARNEQLDQLCDATAENARRLFRLPPVAPSAKDALPKE